MSEANGPQTPTDQELLKVYLAERDVPCPVCGYTVKNLDGPVCPECGSALELRLGSADLHVLPWIAAMLSTSLPAGFFLIVSLVTIYFWISEGPPSGRELPWIFSFYVLTILTSSACLLMIRQRRKFIRKSEAEQKRLAWIIGLVCAGSVLVYMTAFIINNSL